MCWGGGVFLLLLLLAPLLHTRLPNLEMCVHPQNHGWQVGNCSAKLPFMCQKKGETKESAAQPGCDRKDVSSSFLCVLWCVLTALCSVMSCRLSFGRILVSCASMSTLAITCFVFYYNLLVRSDDWPDKDRSGAPLAAISRCVNVNLCMSPKSYCCHSLRVGGDMATPVIKLTPRKYPSKTAVTSP